jgi:hypothetical protein
MKMAFRNEKLSWIVSYRTLWPNWTELGVFMPTVETFIEKYWRVLKLDYRQTDNNDERMNVSVIKTKDFHPVISGMDLQFRK